jgi:hypothetical protein
MCIYLLPGILLFPEKEAKSVALLRRGLLTRTSAKPTLGVWGPAPKETKTLQIRSKKLILGNNSSRLCNYFTDEITYLEYVIFSIQLIT